MVEFVLNCFSSRAVSTKKKGRLAGPHNRWGDAQCGDGGPNRQQVANVDLRNIFNTNLRIGKLGFKFCVFLKIWVCSDKKGRHIHPLPPNI
jgi:hypothetical protein